MNGEAGRGEGPGLKKKVPHYDQINFVKLSDNQISMFEFYFFFIFNFYTISCWVILSYFRNMIMAYFEARNFSQYRSVSQPT